MSTQRPINVFLSRTTTGLGPLAEKCDAVLRERGFVVRHQPVFPATAHDVKGLLAEEIRKCDAVICLVGPVLGAGPGRPVVGLRDPRTQDSVFSYTQLELLIARDMRRPVYTFLISGEELITPYTQTEEAFAKQLAFIKEFIKDYHQDSARSIPRERTQFGAILDDMRSITVEPYVTRDIPENLPFTSLGHLFTGRDRFLAELRQHLASVAGASAIVKSRHAIQGTGGVGKTTAAVEYAWAHAEHYSALLFVTADSPESLNRNLAALCGPLVLNLQEQNEKEQEVQISAALRWLKTHPGWFLIFDNVDSEEAANEVLSRLKDLDTGHVVITSRLSDFKGQVRSLDLDVFTEPDSVRFLNLRTNERRAPLATDSDDALSLVRLLDCLPLALEQAGALINRDRLSYADYIGQYKEATAKVLSWRDDKEMRYPRSVAVAWQASVDQLSAQALQLFQVFAWFAPEPIPRSLLDSSQDPATRRRHLTELDNLSLVRFNSDRTSFSIHRLIQEITRLQQPSVERTETTRGGILGLLKKTRSITDPPPALHEALGWVDVAFVGDPTDVRTWPRLAPLAPHGKVVAEHADHRGIPYPTSRLFNSVASLFNTQASHSVAEPLFRRALELTEKIHGPKHPAVATCLSNLASVLQDTNRLAEAESLYRRALEIDEKALGPSHPNVATRLNNLASLLQPTNRLQEAEVLYRRALQINEKALGPDHLNYGRGLNSLGLLLKMSGRIQEAEALYRRALAVHEEGVGADHPEVAIDLNNLAMLLKATNRLAEAEQRYRRALEIDEKALGPNHPNVAIRLNNLGSLLQAMKRLAEAEPLYRRALSINEQALGPHHPNVALCLNNLGMLLKATERLQEAAPMMHRMVEIMVICSEATGRPNPNLSAMVKNYANLLVAKGEEEEDVEDTINALLAPIGMGV